MPVSLSIRNVPDDVVDALRRRADRNRRSLQGELLTIVETAAATGASMTCDEVYAAARRIHAPTDSLSAAMIREDRDQDHGH